MSYWNYKDKRNEMPNYVDPKETVKEVLSYPTADLSSRGIRDSICELYGVKQAVDPVDGVTPIAWYFPYYDQKGSLVAYKKRDLTKDKSERGHFTTIGSQGVSNKLFGQHVSESIQRKRKNLVVVEGEIDCLSVYQAMVDSVKGTKYADMQPFVVSLSCGTGNAVDSVSTNAGFIKTFEKIILGFDNDSATPSEIKKGIKKGREATESVASALMQDNIFVIQYPEGFKDANEMVVEDKSSELAHLCSFCDTKFSAEKIVTPDSVSFEDLVAPRVAGASLPDFPGLMKKTWGPRLSELWVVTAPSNVGKSLLTSKIMYRIFEQGHTVGMMMLEETNKETLQRFVAQSLRVNYNKFKDNPLKYASEEKIKKAYNDIVQSKRFYMLDHFGSMPISTLMDKIRNFVFVNKVQYILLDHLSMVISGSVVENERKEIDIVMTELAAFCAANAVCIILVNHLNRSIAQDFKPPKGAENQPFWVPVTKESMRGSASLEQLSWVVLGIEPQIMPDKSRGHVRWTVLKNRPIGYLGIADELSIDDDTGEVVLFDSDGY